MIFGLASSVNKSGRGKGERYFRRSVRNINLGYVVILITLPTLSTSNNVTQKAIKSMGQEVGNS